MNQTRLTMLAIICALSSIAVVAAAAVKTVFGPAGVYDQLNLLVDVRHELAENYVEEPDTDKMVDAALRGMVETLDDPYTDYYSRKEIAEFDKQVHGEFSGIGAEIDVRDGKLYITSPLEDSPAWNAGILAGDVVLEVDGDPMIEIFAEHESERAKINAAIERLTGPANTKVTLLVRHRTGTEEKIVVTREKIQIPTVKGARRLGKDGHWDFMLDHDNRIGYIRLTQFTKESVNDFRAAVDQLVEQDARGLIIDLRFNPGGLLQGAVDLSDIFLDGGKRIVSMKGRSVPEKVFNASNDNTIGDLPLVVLANEVSASASEIVTGALLDNDRAVFVGTRTFGKGSVQTTREFLSESQQPIGMLKFTNAYYYLPSGRNIHRKSGSTNWGVDPKPGFYVPMTNEQIADMIEIRRENDTLRRNNGNGASKSITPHYIENELADLQLAAGLRTMIGKVNTGKWMKVGEENVQELALQTRRESLIRQRDLYREGLERIDKEITNLNKQINGDDESGTEEADDAEEAAAADDEDATSDSELELVPVEAE